jgi:hypothetical protein
MAEHNLSWDQVVQIYREVHPDGPNLAELCATEAFEEEQLAANALQTEQLDWEAATDAKVAEAAWCALERQRWAAAMVEIVDATAKLRADLVEARTEMAAPSAAPPANTVIHDIAAADDTVPGRFECACDQRILLASFETLAGDALHRQAWAAEEEAHSYVVAMARGYMCSDLDSLQRRGPSPARVEQENRELAGAIVTRDEAVAEAARDRARFHAQLAGLLAAAAEAAQAEANSMARRVLWDSSLAEALEPRRRQDETSGGVRSA